MISSLIFAIVVVYFLLLLFITIEKLVFKGEWYFVLFFMVLYLSFYTSILSIIPLFYFLGRNKRLNQKSLTRLFSLIMLGEIDAFCLNVVEEVIGAQFQQFSGYTLTAYDQLYSTLNITTRNFSQLSV